MFIDSGARIPACHPLLCIQHSLYRYTCIVHLSPIHSLNTNDSLIAFIMEIGWYTSPYSRMELCLGVSEDSITPEQSSTLVRLSSVLALFMRCTRGHLSKGFTLNLNAKVKTASDTDNYRLYSIINVMIITVVVENWLCVCVYVCMYVCMYLLFNVCQIFMGVWCLSTLSLNKKYHLHQHKLNGLTFPSGIMLR